MKMSELSSSWIWWEQLGLPFRILTSFVFYFVAMTFLIGFTYRQSVGLALILSFLFCDNFPGKPVGNRWVPFNVRLQPNLADMLIALDLVASHEKWNSLLASREPTPPTHLDFEALPQLLSCETLSEPSPLTSGVICWKPWNKYTSEYSFEVPIHALSYPEYPPEFGYSDRCCRAYNPTFFIKLAVDGYAFGFRVEKRWWEVQKLKLSPSDRGVISESERDQDWDCGTVHLSFGVIPLQQMCKRYFQRYGFTQPINQVRKDEQQAMQIFAQTGWKLKPRDSDIRTSACDFEHRFMWLRHDYL